MKKIIAVLVVLAMVTLTGCAQINTFLNSAPVDFVCQPTPDQQATATAMLAALDAAQAAGAMFVPALNVAKASAVLRVIQAGGCFLVAELKAAFDVVDAGNAAVMKKQMKAVKMAPGALPEYKALRDVI